MIVPLGRTTRHLAGSGRLYLSRIEGMPQMYHFQPYLANEPRPAPPPPMPIVFEKAPPAQWEYHVISIDPREDEPLDEAALTRLGSEGWLLANVLTLPSGGAVVRIYYYFVRQAE